MAKAKPVEDQGTMALRRSGGAWLKQLREEAGITQRELALAVGVDYYTFISQIENGRGRVPAERYQLWADLLKIDRKEFVKGLLRFYEPHTYEILYGDE